MSENSVPRGISWPIRILIHLYGLRATGYVRVTEKDLVRQWENLSSSIRTHLTYLQKRRLVELTIVNQEMCFVRLTPSGIAFVETGVREAEALDNHPTEDPESP
jgi:hypothetical protein